LKRPDLKEAKALLEELASNLYSLVDGEGPVVALKG
jgi:hypothetical protein